jgi:hypothetical protein
MTSQAPLDATDMDIVQIWAGYEVPNYIYGLSSLGCVMKKHVGQPDSLFNIVWQSEKSIHDATTLDSVLTSEALQQDVVPDAVTQGPYMLRRVSHRSLILTYANPKGTPLPDGIKERIVESSDYASLSPMKQTGIILLVVGLFAIAMCSIWMHSILNTRQGQSYSHLGSGLQGNGNHKNALFGWCISALVIGCLLTIAGIVLLSVG